LILTKTHPAVLLANLVLTALLSGCTVGPNYHRPSLDVPQTYRGSTTQSATAPSTQPTLGDLMWWDAFSDPTLKQLIHTSLQNNYDLRIAVTRIEQANGVRMQALSQLFPQLGYTGSANAGRNAFLGSPRPNDQITIPTVGTVGPNPYGDSYLAALSVAWEIDLWGRIRRSDEAALAQLLASEDARRNIGLTLVSNVAQTYFQLLALDLERQIAISTAQGLQSSADLFNRKYKGGAASLLEVTKANASQAQVAATIPLLEQQIALTENQLSILLGENPHAITRGQAGLVDIKTPEIPQGLPSQLLERRPDVREAEEQLISANAQVGVAIADFFPKIGLSALYGGTSTDLSQILSKSNVTYSIGADLTGPLFTAGALEGQYKQAKGASKQAALQYQQTVLTAFQEVSDALISRQKLAASIAEDQRAVEQSSETVKLTLDRYQSGKAAYFEVLDAQTQLYAAQDSLAQAQYNELAAFLQLYKALGGGWSAADVPMPTAPTTQPTTR
jgi:multidrug efflux system outer membrane protein